MKFLTKTEFEQAKINRGIKADLESVKRAGLLPPMVRKSIKEGGPGSQGYYSEQLLDLLAIIDSMREQNLSYAEIRKRLEKLVVADDEVEKKKEKVMSMLQEALEAKSIEGAKLAASEALRELGSLEVDEAVAFEQKLEQMNSIEDRLKFILGKNPPEVVKQWQR